MLKLYFPFLGYGIFVFYFTMFLWEFNDLAYGYPYVNLLGAVVLIIIAAPLSLFKARITGIIGIVCMLATLQIFVKVAMELSNASVYLTPLIILMIGLYILGMVSAIRAVAKGQVPEPIKQPLKMVLCVLPLISLFVLFLVFQKFR